jgi:hypothetical protein
MLSPRNASDSVPSRTCCLSLSRNADAGGRREPSLVYTIVRFYQSKRFSNMPIAARPGHAVEFHCRSAANPVLGAQNSAVGRLDQTGTEH